MSFKPDYGPRDFPEDAKDEDNGVYSNMCRVCQQRFIGHKRRMVCKGCSTPNPVIPAAVAVLLNPPA